MRIYHIPLIFAVFAAGATGCNAVLSDVEYSTGDRVGTVDKFSKKGLFFKTNEGQMAMQNFVTNDDGKLTNTFEFSVRDNNAAVKEKLSAAQESRQCVKLSYTQTVGMKIWEQGTRYRIDNVTVVGPSCGTGSNLAPR